MAWVHYQYVVQIHLPETEPKTVHCKSIAEIRKVLGVSTETVSRLIHGRKTIYDSKFTVTRLPKAQKTDDANQSSI